MGTRYAQLSIEERRRIERWRAAKVSPTEMARVLGRHRSTIFRELRCRPFRRSLHAEGGRLLRDGGAAADGGSACAAAEARAVWRVAFNGRGAAEDWLDARADRGSAAVGRRMAPGLSGDDLQACLLEGR